MPWQPALGTQPLAPFDHQVAGQSSMLRYDKTTVCKPLIAREHFLYKTLPHELKDFTPEYRGEIEVQLREENGYIQLYGLCVDDQGSQDVCSCTSSSGSHDQNPLEVSSKETSIKDRSTVRVLRSGSYEVCASTDEVFYTASSNSDHSNVHSLNPWSLKNHKRLLDKMRKSEYSNNTIRFILLKNVVADFLHPCILDLKIGSRLHGDDASIVKAASQSEKCRKTTSSTLGVRLCGMQVYQIDSSAYHSIDKYHGRTLNIDSFRDMLYNFLHNGAMFRAELIQPIVLRLSQLIDCLEKLHSFRFYASSLLIIYDGDMTFAAGSQDVKMQSPKSNITADLTSVQNTKEHPDSSRASWQNVDGQSDEHAHLSTQSCQCVRVQINQQLHSSKGWNQSIQTQPNEACDSLSSNYCLPSLENCSCSQHLEPQVKPNMFKSSSGNVLNNIQTITKKSLSVPETVSNHVYTDTPICEFLQLKSNVVQNVIPDHEKHCYSSTCNIETSHNLNNHLLQQKQNQTSFFSQGVTETFVSSEDASVEGKNDYSELPRELTDTELPRELTVIELPRELTELPRELTDTELPRELTDTELPRALTDTQQVMLDADSLSLDHLSTHISRNPSQTHSPVDNHFSTHISRNPSQTHSPVHNFKHSMALNKISEHSLKSSYSPIVDYTLSHIHNPQVVDNTFSHIHSPQVLSLTDSDHHENTTIPQLMQFVHPLENVSSFDSTKSLETSSQTKQTSQELPAMHQLPEMSNSCRNKVKVDVKMIDFAHTTHRGFTDDKVKHIGADDDYILGLRNLIMLFHELQSRQ